MFEYRFYYIAERFKDFSRNVIVLRGGMEKEQRRALAEQIANIPDWCKVLNRQKLCFYKTIVGLFYQKNIYASMPKNIMENVEY